MRQDSNHEIFWEVMYLLSTPILSFLGDVTRDHVAFTMVCRNFFDLYNDKETTPLRSIYECMLERPFPMTFRGQLQGLEPDMYRRYEIDDIVPSGGAMISCEFGSTGLLSFTQEPDYRVIMWEGSAVNPTLCFIGHTDKVTSVRISPDGQRAVTASWDGTARVWLMVGLPGNCLSVLRDDEDHHHGAHDRGLISAEFSANDDGARIVTGGWNGDVRVWDSQTGECTLILRDGRGHIGNINSAKFSADGLRIVTSSDDGVTCVWDASTGKILNALRTNLLGLTLCFVTSAEFSPNGRRVVTTPSNEAMCVWGVPEDKMEGDLTKIVETPSRVVSAQFSPDGRRILTMDIDANARIWNASTGKCLQTLKGYKRGRFTNAASARFNADGTRVVVFNSHDGRITIYKLW